MPKLYNKINLDNPKSRVLHFCRSIGISSNRTIEDMFNFSNGFFKGSGGMNTDSLLKIAQAYPQLNLDWVICGRGEMILRAERLGMVAQEQAKYSSQNTGKMSKQAIKVFEDIGMFGSKSQLLPPKWYMADGSMVNSDQDSLIRIPDQSLAPLYLKDEYTLVSRVNKNKMEESFESEKLFLCVIKNSTPVISTVKYLENSHSVLVLSFLSSDKEQYPDILLPKSSISELWEVLTVLKF